MKCCVDIVGALPAPVHRRVGADDVVVGEDVREAQFLDALPICTYDCGVSTKLGLREHDTSAHSPSNRMVPQLLPPMKNRCLGPCHSRTDGRTTSPSDRRDPFPITATVGTSGVALDTSPAMGDTQLIDDLISTSDAAMYEAKRAGGNQVCHYPALVPRGAR